MNQLRTPHGVRLSCGSLAVLLAIGSLTPGCGSLGRTPDPAPVVRGPLPLRAQHALALTALAMRPRRAQTQPQGTTGVAVAAAYSSIYEVDSDSSAGDEVVFDGELLRTSARLRWGVGEATDVEVEVSALYTTSGFLDSIVDEFHDFFGLPDGGREKAEDDQFDMLLYNGGEEAYSLEEDRVGLTDIPIIVTHSLRDEEAGGPAVALRAGVEIPTGSEKKGFGNGELDYGAGVLVEKSRKRWTWFGGLDYIVTGDSDGFDDADIEFLDVFQVQGGTEYRWNDSLSLLGQLFLTTPLVDDINLEEIDREILLLGVGAAWDLDGGGRIHASFNEDVIAASGPDFSVFLGVSWGF